MDKNVLDSIKKWPDVPAVYGWLSLDLNGKWKLHQGGSWQPGLSGESIGSPQINEFINRNYAVNERGEWFFQNGPQRVYACLEYTPYVLHLAEDSHTLETHTHQPVRQISAWFLDEQGFLYAQTDLGAAIICGRDTAAVIEHLAAQEKEADPENKTPTPLSETHLAALAQGQQLNAVYRPHPEYNAPLKQTTSGQIPKEMNFIRIPSSR
ncbi:MAG: DUF2946 family protein [Alcaligenaceae bacterium]|nr:DUF2946 family protein [Alcaligenaceae bacterium]